MTIQDIIDRVRANTHDKDILDYEDTTIIDYVNDGMRFIRRTIMAEDPLQLADTAITGELEAGESTIETEKKLSAVLDVRVDGYKLEQKTPWLIDNTEKGGTPKAYYVTGFGTVNLWPVPSAVCTYRILGITDMDLLTNATDVFPMMNEMADFVVEYASIRASLTNEFDITQETTIMGSIVSQIEDMLRRYNVKSIQTSGYWESDGNMVHDYGRRYR